MPERLLLDTDVLIDYLRERPEAVDYLESLQATLPNSVITVAEIYAGVRDGTERDKLDRFLGAFQTRPRLYAKLVSTPTISFVPVRWAGMATVVPEIHPGHPGALRPVADHPIGPKTDDLQAQDTIIAGIRL